MGKSISKVEHILSIGMKGLAGHKLSINNLAKATSDLTNKNTLLVLSQAGVNTETMKAVLAAKGLTDKEIQQTFATVGLTTAQKGASATTFSLAQAYKGLAASIGLSTAALTGFLIGFAAIAAGIVIYSKLNPSLEKTTKELEEQKEAFKEVSKEVESLSDELDTANKRIEELLSKDSLTLVEDEELAKLKETTEELEYQLAIEKQKQRIEARKTADSANEAYNASFRSKYDESGELIAGAGAYGDSPTQELSNTMLAYAKLKDEYESAKKNAQFYANETERLGGLDSLTGQVAYAEYEKYSDMTNRYEQQMNTAEEHALAMYEIINGQKEAYELLYQSGYDLTRLELEQYSTVRQSVEAYDDFCDSIYGVKEAFIELTTAEKKDKLEDKLVLSGVSSDTAKDIVNSMTEEELNVMSKLTFDSDATVQSVKKQIAKAQKIANDTPVTLFSKSQMIDAVNAMSDGFSVLDDIYADILDEKTFDYTKLDTKKFEEAFKNLGDEYAEFIEIISSSPNDIEACQEAFDNLVTAFIKDNNILENVTD